MTSARDRIGLILQLRKRGIRDTRVLRAIERIPREMFVDPAFAEDAYQDIALPIECGQTISQPYIVAFMTEQLGVEQHHSVLEIGTGSGYQAAVLAQLCAHVHTIERHRELQKAASDRLAALGVTNVTTIIGDGRIGWPPKGPYDRIVVTAAAEAPPPSLLEQLKPDGCLLIPLGATRETQVLALFRDGGGDRADLLPVRFVPLVEGRVKRR
jgi:protein-L-isoaspartate(D-aspartate) O-methyltransferase